MNIAVMMILFNEEKFLDICLSRIIDYASKIIVVEGAVEYFWPKSNNGTSTDRTNDILTAWSMQYPQKFIIQHGKWDTKHDMQNAGLKLIPQTSEYIHIVDADELYTGHALAEIQSVLAKEKPDYVTLPMRHWHAGGIILKNGRFGKGIHRIYKNVQGFKFLPKTVNVGNTIHKEGVKKYEFKNIMCDHYGHLNPALNKEKQDYYAWREAQWNQTQ